MPDPLGLAQSVLDATREVFGWWTDEGGRIEAQKRSALRAKKEECKRDLANNDFVSLVRHTAELESLSNQA